MCPDYLPAPVRWDQNVALGELRAFGFQNVTRAGSRTTASYLHTPNEELSCNGDPSRESGAMRVGVAVPRECQRRRAIRARRVWDTGVPKVDLGLLRAGGELVLDLQARRIQCVRFS